MRLINEAMTLLRPGAPFVQFTYAMAAADPEGPVAAFEPKRPS